MTAARVLAGGVVLAATVVMAISAASRAGDGPEPPASRSLAPHSVLASGAFAPGSPLASQAFAPELTISYPLNETLFPPELPPPTFRWTDTDRAHDTWRVAIAFDGAQPVIEARVREPRWTPAAEQWEEIKRRSRERDATVTIAGFADATPEAAGSAARITIRTSVDEVGAPLFYREVNLPFIEAVKDPTQIRWRCGPISQPEPPRVVLEHLPVCGNCHSFSADGRLLGMDVDYANDKGSYALVPTGAEMTLATSNVITWADFRREDGQLTFGLLSQVSPDGRYAISTVKDRSVFVPRPELAFSQLFFPIRGILAVYDRSTREFRALPGADDSQYVQSNPTWSPDGKYIVFARSAAYHLRNDSTNVLLTRAECAEFLDEGKTFLFDLYRVPFNGGAGGVAEPLPGASRNGLSNFFAKYSPDGKWIVFCQARSFMLLQPDSALYIMPAEGGEARRLRGNTPRMNSWHSWSPNGKWLVFSSKWQSDYTQLCLTHIDDEGNSTPPVLLDYLTAPDRAANIPEFVNAPVDAIARIRPEFVDDLSYVRAGDTYLQADNDVPKAIAQYRKALEINPDNAVAHSNLGGLLVTRGTTDEGVSHLREAIRLDPTNGAPYYNLGMLWVRQGKMDDAVRDLSLAVQYRPDIADARRVLGDLLCRRGDLAGGLVQLTEAVRLKPDDPVARYFVAKALAAANRVDEALPHLARAVELDPHDAGALDLYGRLLFDHGRAAEAISALSRAVQLEPGNPRRLDDLALMLVTTPDPAVRDASQAVTLAEQACVLTRHEAIAPLDILGICQAAHGDFPAARQAAQQALHLARAQHQTQLAAGIEERLRLYENEQPFVPPHAPPAALSPASAPAP